MKISALGRFGPLLLAAASLVTSCESSQHSGSESDPDAELIAAVASANSDRFRLEDEITECMAEKGFEYESQMDRLTEVAEVSIVLSDVAVFASPRDSWPESGYGFISIYLGGWLASETTGPSATVLDEDFHLALYGDPNDETKQGCSGDAFGNSGAVLVVEDIRDRRHDAEERVIAAISGSSELADWRVCMAENGFVVDNLDGPSNLVREALEAAFVSHFGDAEQRPILDLSLDSSTGRLVSSSSQAFIDELYEAELVIAAADHECSDELYILARDLLQSELEG